MRFRLRTLLIVAVIVPPLLAYVGSYYVLSRRGFAEADAYGLKGFYFVLPETDRDNQTNANYRRLYWPLIEIDITLGTGRYPGSDPLRGLSP